MSIGARVRRLFGRHERVVSELWRAGFVDLDELYTRVGEWVQAPRRILEIGCGEGAGTERLAELHPDSEISAVDIAANVGRPYSGPRDHVSCKGWARTPTPIHWIAYAADRWWTGDRITYLTTCEAERLLSAAMPEASMKAHGTSVPWRNNHALMMVAA